jgi:hypothetical protein
MEEEEIKEYVNCGDLQDDIDYLEDHIPDKRTKEYRDWMEKINNLMKKYNSSANEKIYKLIK